MLNPLALHFKDEIGIAYKLEFGVLPTLIRLIGEFISAIGFVGCVAAAGPADIPAVNLIRPAIEAVFVALLLFIPVVPFDGLSIPGHVCFSLTGIFLRRVVRVRVTVVIVVRIREE